MVTSKGKAETQKGILNLVFRDGSLALTSMVRGADI